MYRCVFEYVALLIEFPMVGCDTVKAVFCPVFIKPESGEHSTDGLYTFGLSPGPLYCSEADAHLSCYFLP